MSAPSVDPKAAVKAGMSLMEYLIGGLDQRLHRNMLAIALAKSERPTAIIIKGVDLNTFETN
jgi:hypothetical protein